MPLVKDVVLLGEEIARRTAMRGVCVFLIGLIPLYGQDPAITGSGYMSPGITVAPGQIATLFVTGLISPTGGSVKASGFPLPTTLSGVSVTINQSGLALPPAQSVHAAPLLEVQPAGAGLTAVTVQIPFEVLPTSHCVSAGVSLSCPATVTVSQNGAAGQFFPITIQLDNIHILNTCDRFPSANLQTTPCQPIVTHADGSLVSASAPAAQGEEVVVYAFGLGATNPAVKTGDATPSPAPVLNSPLFVQFDSRVNATPSPPYYNPLILAPFIPVPLFAGLTPGLAGLYQINLRIPASLPATMPCTPGASIQAPYNVVTSNLTIDIGASASFDGAAICVAPSQQ